MVSVAVLDELPVLAATANETVPGPAPLDPAVTVSHEAPLTAVQLQVDPAETDTLPAPPEEAYVWLAGEREKLHAAGAL
jgi:NADPH-dependent ferric siderophore reductase